MVEIRGKRGRRVPVLTDDMVSAMRVLLDNREAAGILPSNPFLFARPTRNSKECIRGWDCVQAVASAAALTEPALITSTKLRKYVATVSQV